MLIDLLFFLPLKKAVDPNAIQWFSTDFYALLIRLGINLFFLTILIRFLYYAKTKRKDYLFTYFLIGIITFFLCFGLMQMDIDTKRAEKDKFIKLKAAEVGSWRKQLDFADCQINQMSDDLRQAYKDNETRSHGYDGLLKRIQISHEIGGIIPWIILGVFLCIEMGPIFFKMMLNKGPYDYMVENYNKMRQVEAGVISESLLYESVNGIMHMDKYTYLDYETAKAEREEKMHKQKELNKQIIEEWNQATSKEIKENPSKFFNNDQA